MSFALALVVAVHAARADITMMDHPRHRTSLVLAPPIVERDGVVQYGHIDQPQVAAGIALFGVSYLASVVAASTVDHGAHPGHADLDVPLVGPWLALDNWGHCSASNPACFSPTSDRMWLVADGLVQAAGVLTLLDGLIWPRVHRRKAQDTSLHVKPTTNGMAVFAQF